MRLCYQSLQRIVDGLEDECDFKRVVLEPDEVMPREQQAILRELPMKDNGDPAEVVCMSARRY